MSRRYEPETLIGAESILDTLRDSYHDGPSATAPGATGFVVNIITGHVRVEACKQLGWHSLPAVIRDDE
jgi:hypothetical protein